MCSVKKTTIILSGLFIYNTECLLASYFLSKLLWYEKYMS
jgi:hypothetical protein